MQNRHKSILQINLMETPRRDDLMRTETYLISALILNYLMVHPRARCSSNVNSD